MHFMERTSEPNSGAIFGEYFASTTFSKRDETTSITYRW